MLVGLVKLAQGVEEQVHGAPADSALIRSRSGDELVNSNSRLLAILDNLHDRFFTGQLAVFGMMNFARFEKQDGVALPRIDVQSAGLSRLVQHLHDAR